jgi:alkylation response protein AidB-like acyl-CoA dehydrogenase
LGAGSRPDLYGWDAAGAEAALALGDDRALSALPLDKSAPDKSALGKPDGHDLDLTRAIVPARGQPDRALGGELVLGGILSAQALMRWEALALSTACADLVGLMAGSLQAAVAYAAERVQFGVPIGSFQAVRHMCANQLIETEAARSVTRYAAWAVDELAVEEALLAARTAKAFCARAASKVIESGIQVHGGMGYTWECLDHLRLRRAITSSNLLGGEHHQTRQIARTRPRGHR